MHIRTYSCSKRPKPMSYFKTSDPHIYGQADGHPFIREQHQYSAQHKQSGMNLSILKRNAVVGLTGPTWSPIALLVCPYSSCRCLFRECFNLNQTRSLAIFNFSIEGPEKKRKKKNKLPRLAKAFFIRVAESNRNFYIFLSHAYMKCPLQRRHHESYSESLAVKIG